MTAYFGRLPWTSNVPTWTEYDQICLALTEIDTTAPTLTRAAINDATTASIVLLAYDEALDTNSGPDKSAFEVKVEGPDRNVTNVLIDGRVVHVSVSPDIRPGEGVTVSYTVPGTNPTQDEAGNDAPSITDFPVANNLAATAPDAPGNLAASPGADAGTMVLTWETPWANGRDIRKFQARYAEGSSAGGTWADISGSDGETTTHTVTGLTAGTQYTFEVRAVNANGDGDAATVTATVIGVPAAPTSLTAAAAATTTPQLAFDLSWTAPASDGGSAITKHQYRHKSGSGAFGSWTDIANSAAGGDNATSYTVKGLTASNPPTTFTFEVRAVNANGESTASNQASATVDLPTSVFPTLTPGAGELRVEWTTPANNGSAILKYQAWVFDDTNQIEITAYADIPGSDANTTSHTVTGLANGIAHVVAIRAVNSVGHSAASLPDAVTPATVPTAPRSLTAPTGNGEVRLGWQAPESDGGNTITGYEYRQKTGTGSFGSWMNIVGADENTTEHTVTGLTNGTAYTFEVRARNPEGESGPSNQASATPVAADTTAPMLQERDDDRPWRSR